MTVQPQQWLAEFSPATNFDGGQYDARVVQLENGNVVVAWTSESRNGAAGVGPGSDVIARIFDPLGQPVGDEFRVNQNYIVDDEKAVELVALKDGGFYAVFLDANSDGQALRMDRFDAYGNEVDSRFDIPGATNADTDFAVAVSTVNTVMTAFHDNGEIKARVYFPNYDTFGAELVVARSSGGAITDVKLAALDNGNIALTAIYHYNAGPTIVHKVMTSSGLTVSGLSFTGGTNTNGRLDNDPDVAALSDGGFAVVWRSVDGADRKLLVQLHTETGSEIGEPIDVNQGGSFAFDGREPVITATMDGGFMVAFRSVTDGTIKVRNFDAEGKAIGGFVTVADASGAIDPRLETLEDGRVFVTWTQWTNSDNVASAIIDPRDIGTKAYGDEAPTLYAKFIGTVDDETVESDAAEAVHTHAGDDVIEFFGSAGDNPVLDGGKGFDTLEHQSGSRPYLHNIDLKSIEAIRFGDDPSRGGGFGLTADQFGQGGVAKDLHLNGAAAARSTLTINLEAPTLFSMTQWTFENWVDDEDTIILWGSGGNDTIRGSDREDEARLGTGDDRMNGYDGHDYIRGQEGDDTLNGSKGDDELRGDEGDDRINGGAGNDTLTGGRGVDAMKAGVGNDEVRGDDGNDRIYAHHGDDEARGGEGNDIIYGGNGNDTLWGDNGDDTLRGGKHDDAIQGGNGDDDIEGGSGRDVLEGDSGHDSLSGGDGNDTLKGEGGEDTLNGGDNNDLLDGGSAEDRLNGGAGNDTLDGGLGVDFMTGGNGKDHFRFNDIEDSAQANYDTISDFLRGSDVIDLSGIDANARVAGNQDFRFIGDAGFTGAGQVRAVEHADGTRILARVDDTGSADFRIDLDGMFVAMSADDFIL